MEYFLHFKTKLKKYRSLAYVGYCSSVFTKKLILILAFVFVNFMAMAGLCDITIEGNFCVTPGSVESYAMDEHTNYSDQGACTKWEVWGGEVIQYGVWTTPSQIQAEWYDGHWIVSDCNFNDAVGGVTSGYSGITIRWNNDSGLKHIKLRASGVGVLGVCGNEYTETSISTSIPTFAQIISSSDPKGCNNLGFTYTAQWVNGVTYWWQLPNGWTTTAKRINVLGIIYYETAGNSISGVGTNSGGQIKVMVIPQAGLCGNIVSTTRNVSPFSSPLNLTVSSSPSTAMVSNYIYVCNGGTTRLSANVSGGTPPYSYIWSPALNSNNPSCWWNCATVDISANQVTQGSLVTVTVTDAKGCQASNTMTVAYGDQTWQNSNFFTNFNPQEKVLTEHNSNYDEVPVAGENIVVERLGNPYYVGADGNIWMYKFQTAPYNGWANIKLTNLSSSELASGELAIYEPTWGNRIVYYKTVGGRIRTIGASDYTSIPTIQGIAVNAGVNGKFTVDNSSNLFFIGSGNKIYKSTNPTIPLSNNLVIGQNTLATGNRLYYVGISANGNALKCMDYNGLDIPLTGSPAVLLSTKLDTDGSGRVFFAGTDKTIYYLTPATNTITGIWQTPGCNGNFNINKTSGVIYYGGLDSKIYQAYYQSSWWQTKQLTNLSESPYDIQFANPNVFYVSSDNHVKMVWYPTGFCNPNVLKTAANSSGDHLADVSELPTESNELGESITASPNPFSTTTVISYTLKEISDVKVVVSDMAGREVKTLTEEQGKSAGTYSVEFNGSTLTKGIYITNVIINGRKSPAVKLIVQ